MTEEPDELTRLRQAIDDIDKVLVKLLNQRAKYALQVGRVKKESRLPVYSPEREQEVLQRIRSYNGGPLSSDALQRLFERIIDESRRLERQVVMGEATAPEESAC